jgi:hypothetical protein
MLSGLVPTEIETIHVFGSRHDFVSNKSYETMILSASFRLLKYSLVPCQLIPHKQTLSSPSP